MNKFNKHGILIMEVKSKRDNKSIKNPYFCKCMIEECKNKANNNYNGLKYCDECYMKIIDYGNHAFD